MNRNQSHEKKSFGAGATVMKTNSSGARATFLNRGAPNLELCPFYDSSSALFLSRHILEVK